MEKNINLKIQSYTASLKNNIKLNAMTMFSKYNISASDMNEYIKVIYNIEPLILTPEDIKARTRIKNTIPCSNRCIAKRANKEQCTRKQKATFKFCGTHIKCCPHGVIDSLDTDDTKIKINVFVKNIRGILYYIDSHNNVYKPEDIIEDKINPEVLCKCVIDTDGNYSIPALNIY